MKPLPLFIAASLVGNALLLGVLFLRSPAVADNAKPETKNPKFSAPASSQSAVDPALWKSLNTSDLASQTDRLRAAGFPPNIVRAILLAQIRDSFAARRKAIIGATNPTSEFWKNAQPTDPKIANELRALQREQTLLTNELLGPDPQPNPLQAIIDGNRAGLSPSKADYVARIKRDYSEMRSDIYLDPLGSQTADGRAQLALLDKEQRADIERSLSPEELLTYDLYTSNTANTLRNQLIGFNPTEAEFRAIFEKRQAYDQKYSPTVYDIQSLMAMNGNQEYARQRAEAQKQMNADIAAMLGPERGAEYQRTSDGNFQQVMRVVDRLGLPTTAAVDAWNLQKDIQQRAQAVQTNRQLPVEDRNAQLAALSAEANAKLTAALGQRGFDVYKQNGGTWLQMLQPRPAPPPGAAGARGGVPGSGTTVIRSIGN